MKIKFLSDKAIAPRLATGGAVAYDLYVPKDTVIHKGRQIVPLDFAIEIPEGYEAKIEPRSGFSSKGMEGYQVVVGQKLTDGQVIEGRYCNLESSRFDADVLVGKIDWDYRGNVGVIVKSYEDEDFLIKAGTRIAQMTFYQIFAWDLEEVAELSETDRGEGGFGSTGTK
jgi:dUTP pyrophosphatase